MKYYITILFLLGSIQFLNSSNKINFSCDTNSVFIGDEINCGTTLKAKFPIDLSNLTKFFENNNLFNLKIDSIKKKKEFVYYINFDVQSFDTGLVKIPPFEFLIDSQTILSNSLDLSFINLEIPENSDIYDIKSPLNIPYKFSEFANYIYFLLFLLLLFFLIIKLLRKKNDKNLPIKKIEVKPHIHAIKKLKILNSKNLLEDRFIKQFYIELSEIIKFYFDKEFNIETTESTSKETIDLLRKIKLNPDLISKIEIFLNNSDLVKFAKVKPENNINKKMIDRAIKLVNSCHNFKIKFLNG